MYELDATAIFVSFVVTWSIGLLPPIIIRYGILKRPIAQWPAIGTCVLLWAINIILFTALGSQNKAHGALVLIAFVSYWILRRGVSTKNKQEQKTTSVPAANFAIRNNSLNDESFSGERARVSKELSPERDGNDANKSPDNRIVGRKETRVTKRVDPFEEALYEQIAAELLSGQVKQGLWLKATVESGGNEHKTKSLYTQFRIAQILEETAPDDEAEKQRHSETEAIERDRVVDLLRQHQYAVEEKELGAWVLYSPSGECNRFPSFTTLADYAHDVLNRAVEPKPSDVKSKEGILSKEIEHGDKIIYGAIFIFILSMIFLAFFSF